MTATQHPGHPPKRGRTVGLAAAWVGVTLVAGIVAIGAAADGSDGQGSTDVDGAAAADEVATPRGDLDFGTGRSEGQEPPGDAAPPQDPGETDPPSTPQIPQGAMLLFDDADAGFTTVYPPDWVVERDGGTTIFSGQPGTQAYDVTFVVQTVLTTQAGGEHADAAAMFQVVRAQIQSAGGEILGEADGEISLSIGSRPTGTLVAIFPQDPSQPMDSAVMQMVATVFARDDTRVIAITYTAPQDLYDTYFEVASTMFAAFDVIG